MLKKLWIVLLVALNIGCDQVSKEIVRDTVLPMEYIQVAGDYFILTNVENTGAMLGFGQDFTPIIKLIFLQALPVLVLCILLINILMKKNLEKASILAFAFVIGGGIGNLIDRIAYGSVTDFFQIKLGFFKTGIFNMADVSVTVGVLLILFLSIRHEKIIL
ncbi:signal peptidase II [Costertonia aggregata]|uniref:Lipoprotein signal peptidase n=1 Tax=Costertonia aggregata TaxID=343403 RepID=A0A7H9AJP1_9FLAO|nr:signal peptidase II [Costertonia aggregata]QLG43800.1 signal peptidase II [Costertonia aggregata]